MEAMVVADRAAAWPTSCLSKSAESEYYRGTGRVLGHFFLGPLATGHWAMGHTLPAGPALRVRDNEEIRADATPRSINTGFQSLRTALPSSIPTDSKAIILRKAVSHITHLEALLRKAGIPIAPSPPGLNRGDSGSTRGEEEDEEDDSNDVVMRETTGAVATLKMDKGGWENVHVEDVEVTDAKPAVKVRG